MPRLPARRASAGTIPLFPSYVFARIEGGADDLLRIRSAPGVAYVLPRAGPPAVLPDAVIEAMQQRESELLTAGNRRLFNHGDAVRVTSGPFKWIEGLFDRRVSAAGRVRILLDLVHGCAAVEIDAVDLEPTEPRRTKRVAVRGGM